MIGQRDERWLKEVLSEFCEVSSEKPSKEGALLEGFSMLVRNMVKNIEKNLSEARELWQDDPGSAELKEKFDTVENCLIYLERYCREKIGRDLKKIK